MNLIIASILIFLLNIPFGYWRANHKKLTLQWFLAIHIPIPFVVLIRFLFKLGFKLYTYPFIVLSFYLGQLFGAKLYNYMKNKQK